ncbi:ethanolamine ammonia-lyase subunit EutC [Mangrovicoccus sp. HB161399]|uniref:ethanolamine ammonia-lyase subunit EutC n=1 Tax=Mangrovicoccus sp. HB161399 TaxID=2720392 RepID=UPI001553DA73|nr:ethanolamine ammonia-lyase subunit EutC [Mangrovicoccus sp. HB161399]
MTRDLDPFGRRLRALTPARVRLDPEGGATPLASVLDFQLCHARARDAIRLPVDWQAVKAALAPREAIELQSRAPDRDTYIRRPDLGRRLAPDSLARIPRSAPDLAIVIADGLSASAVAAHAAPMVEAVAAALTGFSIGPVALVREGRVAAGDEVAEAMGARLCLMLIGERPGLSVSDSLGAYLTFAPRIGTTDSARNCVSNIHGNGGLPHAAAADLIAYLARRALEIGATGVALKDERGQATLPSAD